MADTARYAVFGQPIAHSLSPRIHAMFGAALGIPVDYRAIEASSVEFPGVLDAFARDAGRGANVTLPLKQDAAALCSSLSERARRCGSVNTLIRDGDGWRGDSTDGAGFITDLRERHAFDPRGKTCLLIGAGGAAHAVAFALADAGVERLAIANRTNERAEALAAAISGAVVVPWNDLANSGAFDLVVNATAAGHSQTRFDLPASLVAPRTLAYDLSYGAAAASFLAWAAGVQAIDGLGMLVEQAAESFAIWHGRRPDTQPVYAALRRG